MPRRVSSHQRSVAIRVSLTIVNVVVFVPHNCADFIAFVDRGGSDYVELEDKAADAIFHSYA